MPTISEMYPSVFISGEDLKGKAFTLTIKSVKTEQIFDVKEKKKKMKWVLYFAPPAKKGCLIGKTQATEIMAATNTTNTDDWPGKKVEIYPKLVDAFGKKTMAPRFRSVTSAGSSEVPSELQQEAVIVDEDEEHDGEEHEPPHNDAPPPLPPPSQEEERSPGEQLFPRTNDPMADVKMKSSREKLLLLGSIKSAKTVQSLDTIAGKAAGSELIEVDLEAVNKAIEEKRVILEEKK